MVLFVKKLWALLLLTTCILMNAAVATGDAPIGFAAIPGDGLSTTTGGGSATPEMVTTFAELSNAVSGDTPRVIIVYETISTLGGGSIYPLHIDSNKTIMGANANAQIYGGFAIHDVNNIIIRDLDFRGRYPDDGPVDAINIDNSHHVWLDHLDVHDASDGNLDIVHMSSYITVSWCKFFYTSISATNDHRLCTLVGSGGGDHIEDWGRLKVTFHHNWYADMVLSRMPQMMYGRSHSYNNYFASLDNWYCISVGSYGSILVENNYFHNVFNPHSHFFDVWCYIVARGNIYDNSPGNTDTGLGGSRDAAGHEHLEVLPFETAPYSYPLDIAADVPSLVTSGAGPRTRDESIRPTPDPMTWVQVPHLIDRVDISMTAATATDLSGIEYYFANLTDPNHDSGWQISPTYIDTGLDVSTTYTYQVKARDFSINQNETDWSEIASETTLDWMCTEPIAEDINDDCQVNLVDFSMLAAEWMSTPLIPNLVINGDFATDLSDWTTIPDSPTTITWDNGAALLARNDATFASDGSYLHQAFEVISGTQYKIDAQWKGDLLNGGTGRNWAEVIVGFGPSPTNISSISIVYKKVTDGGPNETPMPWDWESILLSPDNASSPADGIFTATDSYMAIAFKLGGLAGVGPGYFYVDDVRVFDADAPCPEADLIDDCQVNIDDLAVLAAAWLNCNRVPSSQCGL